MRKFLLALAVLVAVLIAYGFAGQVHRSAEAVALLRPVFGLICALSVMLARSVWVKVGLGAAAALAFVTVGVHFVAQRPGGDIRIYSKNIGYQTTDTSALVGDIRAAEVDVVMLQEVTSENEDILQALAGDFPHQTMCRFTGRIGIAIASRHPFDGAPVCADVRGVLAVPIVLDGRPLWAVSVHIPWPWPYDTVENERAAEEVFARLVGPVVIAGDFNMIPWAGRVLRVAAMTETRLAGPTWPTLYLGPVPLPIDLVMAPGGGFAHTRPEFGSAHRGVVADLSVWQP